MMHTMSVDVVLMSQVLTLLIVFTVSMNVIIPDEFPWLLVLTGVPAGCQVIQAGIFSQYLFLIDLSQVYRPILQHISVFDSLRTMNIKQFPSFSIKQRVLMQRGHMSITSLFFS